EIFIRAEEDLVRLVWSFMKQVRIISDSARILQLDPLNEQNPWWRSPDAITRNVPRRHRLPDHSLRVIFSSVIPIGHLPLSQQLHIMPMVDFCRRIYMKLLKN
ncbi:hypothetical protein HKBW3S47_02197, partial [Candidatus Hakubella thermalkaliphila]